MSSSANNSAFFNTLVQHLLNDETFKAALSDHFIPSASHVASSTLQNVSTACAHSNVHVPSAIVPVTPHITMQSSESVSAHDHSVSNENRGRQHQSGSGYTLSSAPSFDAKRSDDRVDAFTIGHDYSIFSDKPCDGNARFFDLVGDSSDAEGECEDGKSVDVSISGNDFGIGGNTEHGNVDFCVHDDVNIDVGVDAGEEELQALSFEEVKERMSTKPFSGVIGADEASNGYSFGDTDSLESDLLDVWTAPDTSGKKQKVDHPVQSPDGTNVLEMLESGFSSSQNSGKKAAYSYLTPNRNYESPSSLDFFSFLSTVAKGESNQQFDPSSFVSVFRSKLGSHDDEFNFDTATMGEQASKCFCVID